MIYLVIFIVCCGASIIGSICGIGGGVIIKPILDALGVMDIVTLSFLSGCTVLSMTLYSVVKNKLSGGYQFKIRTGLPLAFGAACGGVIGKVMFQYIIYLNNDSNKVGLIQAICLLIVTVGTLIYTICKKYILTLQVTNIIACILIGIVLGILSSFLGIGGGPINLVFLFFFFSMNTKIAAENSLYIIFFSQIASLTQTLVTGKVPIFELIILILMVIGGLIGGIIGRFFNSRMNEKMVDKLFIKFMFVMILINIFNIFKFM